MIASVPEIRMLAFPCSQFMNQMPEGDGDEMLCHLKSKNAAPGAIMAKVRILNVNFRKMDTTCIFLINCFFFGFVCLHWNLGEC